MMFTDDYMPMYT